MPLKLDQYISELLEDHDCVIVPDFGGFVANYAAARINPISDRFDPPYRKVSFNRLLTHNDGLLTAYIARKEEDQYDEARRRVKEYVVFLKDELKEHQKVKIEKVGMLYRRADGTFQFEQLDNPAHFKEGFGLEAFFAHAVERKVDRAPMVEPKTKRVETPASPEPQIAKTKAPSRVIPITSTTESKKPEPQDKQPLPAKKETTAEQKNTQDKPTPVKEEVEAKKKRRYWPAAAAIIGLPLIGYAVWISMTSPLFDDRSKLQWSDLNPLNRTEEVYHARINAFDMAEESAEEPVIIEDHETHVTITRSNDPDKTLVVKLVEPENVVYSSSKDLRYHVIGGCFSMESNARGLVDLYRRKGNNAAVIDQSGSLLRVSVGSFATKKEAKDVLASVRNEIPGAWLLYK